METKKNRRRAAAAAAVTTLRHFEQHPDGLPAAARVRSAPVRGLVELIARAEDQALRIEADDAPVGVVAELREQALRCRAALSRLVSHRSTMAEA